MSDLENRYRSVSRGKPSARGEAAPVRKPVVGRKPEMAPEASQYESAPQATADYDDFLQHVDDMETIIDIDNRSDWRRFVDTVDEYKDWLRGHKDRLLKALKKQLQKIRAKQPSVMEVYAAAKRKFLQPLLDRFGSRNVGFVTVSLIGLLLIGVVLSSFVLGSDSSSDSTEVAVLGDANSTPDFTVAAPQAVTEDEKAVFFDPTLGAASYSDIIEGQPVVISQQPLTDEQKDNRSNSLGVIARGLSADASFESKFGRTFIGNPIFENRQTQIVVFMTDELLMFIRINEAVLSPESINEYIARIQT